jgi:hypothetical protein
MSAPKDRSGETSRQPKIKFVDIPSSDPNIRRKATVDTTDAPPEEGWDWSWTPESQEAMGGNK